MEAYGWNQCSKPKSLKNEVETSEISAMSHPLDLSQPTRQDEVTEENLREELLKNAPSVQSGLFLVPKVIEGEE